MKLPQYNPAIDNPPLTEQEMDELDELLSFIEADDAVADMESLDGYLTALLLSPALPEADVWVTRVWGGQDPAQAPFGSGKQTKKVAQLVLRHLASIDRQLRADPEALEPLFGIAEVEAEDSGEVQEIVDAELWCIGFLQGTAMTPEHWNRIFDDAELADALTPIVLLGSDPETLTPQQQELVGSPEGRDTLSRQVPEAIAELARHSLCTKA